MNNETRISLIQQYGTPLYILDMDAFVNNFRELETAYKNIYKNYRIAYSFKTNYTPAICRKVNELGGYAEVVSDLEYNMAKKCGFSPKDIIVNGPGKWSGMEEMVQDGALVMLDNSFELDRAIDIAQRLGKEAQIGFRLNFEIGSGKNSRFGFDALSKETERQIERARATDMISIKGLHFHLSGARSLDAWKQRADKMIGFADKMLAEDECQIIDLGSGMFGHLDPQLALQFDAYIPTFKEYADTVAGIFNNRFKNSDNCPQLVTEPGTTIVANTMEYASTVIAIKDIRGRKIAIVDGSVQQLGEMGKKKALPITVIHANDNSDFIVNAEITGYTCLEDDILCRSCINPVKAGDRIILGNAGAYSNVLKPPFIQAGCKIVEYSCSGGARLIKREETVNDILLSYLV